MIETSEDAKARIEAGHMVGELAKGMFGPFVDVTVMREDGSQDRSAMIRRTQEEMARGTPVICEAAFSYGGLYCAVDLLRKTGNGWALFEVKSTNGLKDSYVADVSYQKYVLENCGISLTGVYLVCVNNTYILGADGVVDPEKYFQIIDLWDEASQAQADTVPAVLRTAERILECADEPSMELAEACISCDCFHHCFRSLPEPCVFDLYRLNKAKMIICESSRREKMFSDSKKTPILGL